MSARRFLLGTVAAAALCLAAAPTAGAMQNAPTPVCSGTTCTITFPYAGDAYTWTVPANVTGPIAFDVVGAHGGVSPAGSGARVQASYSATPGETLTITPGGKGGESGAWTPGGGGFNGGGAGYYHFTNADSYRTNTYGGGGGGASDVRAGGTGLANRILVAGGGGGGSRVEDFLCYGPWCDPARYHGGGGDAGRVGENGRGDNGGQPGGGATQAAGGAGGGSYNSRAGSGMAGVGGNGVGSSDFGGGGGGGGGWYGGGGGSLSYDTGASGGGGGSSYAADTLTGIVYTSGYGAGDGSVTATFTVTAAPMLMKSSPTPVALMDGSTYAYRFTATGSPAPTFTIASGALPAGMTLDAATGMVSGMPLQAGNATFRIAATNAHGTATSGQVHLTAGDAPMFTRMAAPPTAALHMPYGYTFKTMGSPAPRLTVAKGALPPGLELKAGAKAGNAMLVGRPTHAGRYSFTLQAKSSAGSATHRITLTVAPQAPMVMGSPFAVTRRADGRLMLQVKLMPMPGSPMRKVHVAVYARSGATRGRQSIPPLPPGIPSIPDLNAQIANGTATAGAGATSPIDLNALLQLGMQDPSPAVYMVITGIGSSGLQVHQMYAGSLRLP